MQHPTNTESLTLEGLAEAVGPALGDEGQGGGGAGHLDGRFTLLNPAWEQVLGWTREELLARPMQELMHPDDVEQTLTLMLAGSRHPAHLENFTNRYPHRDRSWRW